MKALKNTTQPSPKTDHPPLALVLRQFPQSVWILFIGTFINRFGTFVVPFLALHLTRLGYSIPQAGLAMGAYGVGHFVASAIGGHLADTIGRRNTIVISMFAAAGSMILLSQAESLLWLVILAFLAGATGEFYKPASSALLADEVSESNRVTAFAAYRFAINAGWAIGPAVAGLLANYSYFWLFLGDAITSALFGLVAWIYLPRTPKQARKPWREVLNAPASLIEAAKLAFGDRRFVRLTAASLVVGLVFMQVPTTLGLEIKAAGFANSVYGLVLALNGVIIILVEIPLSSWTRRLRSRPVIAWGYALMGLGTLVFAFTQSVRGYVIGMIIFTAGEMVSMPVAMAYISRLAPEGMRGRYMGVFGLTWATAIACGPGLGMLVFSIHPASLWIGCGVLGIVAAAIIGRSPPQPLPVLTCPAPAFATSTAIISQDEAVIPAK